MPFSSEQLQYAANAAINYFLRNDPIDNVNIARPLIKKLMGWEPSTRLADGMEKTYRWIYDQMASKAHK